MKTFDEKDLITWSNRHDAKIKTSGYCANSINELKQNIENNIIRMLSSISDDHERCFNCCTLANKETYEVFSYGFFLPVEAVKEEKKYRACKNIKEFYELVFNFKSKMSEKECIDELLGTPIRFRGKYQNEFYVIITQIGNVDGKPLIGLSGTTFSFNELFNNFEIEINGEWLPFGVLE